MVLRSLIYSVAIFITLGIIALLVAGIMKIIYSMVHKGEKKVKEVNKSEAKVS
jgi:hypothetical protein